MSEAIIHAVEQEGISPEVAKILLWATWVDLKPGNVVDLYRQERYMVTIVSKALTDMMEGRL